MTLQINTSLQTIATFEQSSLLSDSDRADIVYIAENRWIGLHRIKLRTQQIQTLYVERDENEKMKVSIQSPLIKIPLSVCTHSSQRDSHYFWKTCDAYAGAGLGSLVRATKEILDGTLGYEHAIGKKLAIPLIKWGYVPHALSRNGLIRDVEIPTPESTLLDVFEDSYGYVLKNPIWLKYDPDKAKPFLEKLRGSNYVS